MIYEEIHVHVTRIGADAVFFYMEGIDDRNAAERLRGELVYVDRAHAVQLDENSAFICDLIGLTGVTDDGRNLGMLRDVLQPGGNDVYVFRGSMGEVLVPALQAVWSSACDLDEGKMLPGSEKGSTRWRCSMKIDVLTLFPEMLRPMLSGEYSQVVRSKTALLAGTAGRIFAITRSNKHRLYGRLSVRRRRGHGDVRAADRGRGARRAIRSTAHGASICRRAAAR